MDGGRFDGLTKVLARAAEPTSRRRTLKVLAGGVLCTALGRLRPASRGHGVQIGGVQVHQSEPVL